MSVADSKGVSELALSQSNRAAVLETLRLSSRPLDDDELSRRTRITPRQTVNQICRRLRDEGVISRTVGPDGKIVNALVVPHVTTAQLQVGHPLNRGDFVPKPAAVDELRPGHSFEQRAAEAHLLSGLSKMVGRRLAPAPIRLPSGVRVELDGVDEDQTVLVECWAHIGTVKVAQRHKVLSDAFKLTWIATNIPGRPRLILCLADDEAAVPFRNRKSWYGQALADHGIEVVVVALPDEVRSAVLAAQRRQYR